MPRPKKPHVVKRVIRGKVRYVVDLGMIEGKRVARIFKVRADADEYLSEKKEKLERHGHTSLALSEDERISFQAARDRLARANATITQAVEFYLAHHRPLQEEVTLKTLFERCALEKDLAGGRPKAIKSFKASCRSFLAGRESALAHLVTRDEIKRWIRGNGFAPKTQRVYLGDVRTLLSWAKEEKYVWTNPIAGDDGYIELSKMDQAEISAFDLDVCRTLLKTALLSPRRLPDIKNTPGPRFKEFGHREVIGYLALGLFCGVRPEELARVSTRDMDLRERAVIVAGSSAKTRKRRVIALPRVAVIWLRLWRRLCPDETLFTGTNFRRRWDALRRDAGLLPEKPKKRDQKKAAAVERNWPHDILRHTCATYTFAAEQNAARLQALLGHSEDEDTLFQHYRAVRTLTGKMVSERMGKEFLALTPRQARLWKD